MLWTDSGLVGSVAPCGGRQEESTYLNQKPFPCIFLLFPIDWGCSTEHVGKGRKNSVLAVFDGAVNLSVCMALSLDSLQPCDRHRRCDVAPKMPGLCSPGLVLRKNKTNSTRLFKASICSCEDENCGERAQVCRTPAQSDQVHRKLLDYLFLCIIDF